MKDHMMSARLRRLKKWCLIITLLVVSPIGVTWADPALLDRKAALRSALEQSLPGLDVTEMSEDEVIPGWWQLDVKTRSGNKVVYVDTKGRYILVGSVFDLKTGHNLTRQRLVTQRARIFAEIDWSMAIMANGRPLEHGASRPQRPLLYFTDPDCPYCQRFQPEIRKLVRAGYRVAVLLFPSERQHPDAPRKAASIWCAKDRMLALESALRREKVSDPDVSCSLPPLEAIRDLAKQFGITGTPSLVLPGGEVIRGFQSAEAILTWLERSADKQRPTNLMSINDVANEGGINGEK
ncbi:MAG: hypothetical protein NPIRA02_00690 [Nitrospirales bacterium]|nr:MAG: hypothetical protein NPIRA02_00690 [Nitrospirales bacterium]